MSLMRSVVGLCSVGLVALTLGAGCARDDASEPETGALASAFDTAQLQALADEIAGMDAEAKAAWHAWKAAWDEYAPLAQSRFRTPSQCARMVELQPTIAAALQRMNVSTAGRDAALVRYNAVSRAAVQGKPVGGPTRVAVQKVSWGLMGRLLGKAVVMGSQVLTMKEILELPSASDLEDERHAAAQCDAPYDPSMSSAYDIPKDTTCFQAATQLASIETTILTVYGANPSACTARGRARLAILKWQAQQYEIVVNNCAYLMKYDIGSPGFEEEDQQFDALTCPASPTENSGPSDNDPSNNDSSGESESD